MSLKIRIRSVIRRLKVLVLPNRISFTKSGYQKDLIIFDDVFPFPYSDWRVREFMAYLDFFERAEVNSGKLTHKGIEVYKGFENDCKQLKSINTKAFERIFPLTRATSFNAKLAYCIFLNNVHSFFPFFKKYELPFAFTLYPGGGFRMNDPKIEKRLKKIFRSKLFRHVFVNMPFVKTYLIEKLNVPVSKITYIYGTPIMVKNIEGAAFQKNVEKIRVIFAAHKYSKGGVDKGFDLFCETAHFFQSNTSLEFIVIGNFSQEDQVVPVKNIIYYGELLPDQLFETFTRCHIVLSPNRYSVLGNGSFDGFPTASVVHAASAGCLMMMTDYFNASSELGLEDGSDFIKIEPDVQNIIEKIEHFLENKSKIAAIAENGRIKILNLYNEKQQLRQRLDVLEKLIRTS